MASGALRPCTGDALEGVLKEILDEVENALTTLTQKKTLQLAEEKLSLAEGTLFDKRSDHYEWADGVLYQLLGAMVDANPNVVENLKTTAPGRRPRTAYLLWLEDNRSAIQTALGGKAKGPDLLKKGREMWGELTDEVKAGYEAKSAKAKEEHKASTEGSGKAAPSAPKKKGKGKVLGYHLFVKANRASIASEFPDLSVADTTRKVAEKWKEAPTDEKKKYEDQAAEVNAASGDADEKSAEPPAKRQRKPSAKKSKDNKDDADDSKKPTNTATTDAKAESTTKSKETPKKQAAKAAPKKAEGKKTDAKKTDAKKAEPKADKGKKAKPEDKDGGDAKKPAPKRKPAAKKAAKNE